MKIEPPQITRQETELTELNQTDITTNVSLRLLTPEERDQVSHPSSISPAMWDAIITRMPGALRDEAIWQFHTGRGRGLILRMANYSLRYVPISEARAAWGCQNDARRDVETLLDAYDPRNEAIVVSECEDFIEVSKIGPCGREERRGLYTCGISDAGSGSQRK